MGVGANRWSIFRADFPYVIFHFSFGHSRSTVSEARPLGRAIRGNKPLLTRGLLTLSPNDE